MLWAYDDELDFEEQPIYAQNCILDARESACMSTVLALTQHIAKMGPGGHEDALIELRDYFRERVEQCVFELGDGYPLTFYNSIDASWGIEREWNQPDLGDIVTLYLDVLIDGVEADAPPLECEDLELNNTWLFYSESQPQIYATEVVLDEGDASLVGPCYGAAQITASDDFASIGTSCTEPYCSYASFSEGTGGVWSIDTMMLLVDGPLTITNGTVSEDVYNARIELMGSAVGTWSGSPVEYDVEAGDAVFLVAGEADGEYVTLAVTNSTAISASELTGGEWSFGSFEFEIEYIDDSTNIWTVAVNASNWLE